MPYDNTGTFTIINSCEQDRINGVSIDSAHMDANLNDIASGLSNVMLRSGAVAMNGALNMNNYKVQNVADGTASTDAVNKGQLDSVNNAAVKLTGNQTIAGTKTFSTTPVVGTKGNSDNSTAAASTAYVHNILSALYPVGSIYIGTQNSCPLATLISGSTWALVATDRALWGGNGSNGNSTINAGLPNITGRYNHQCLLNWGGGTENGALYTANVSGDSSPQNAGGSDGGNSQTIAFDASKSNSIYGKSNTVQPPAYRVNVWRRTA